MGVAAGAAFLIITTLHVVLGELAPKSMAIALTPRVVLALATPMRLFYLATKPLVDVFNAMGNLVMRPFGVPPASDVGSQPQRERTARLAGREPARRADRP